MYFMGQNKRKEEVKQKERVRDFCRMGNDGMT